MAQCFRVIARRLWAEGTLSFAFGASCAKNRATSAAVLTKPAAGAMALAGLSPAITRRRPTGSRGEWPRANGIFLAIGTSGMVSRRPAESTISRLIQTGYG